MKTKKLILVIFLTFIGAIGAYAQKTNVRMQETQARLLDVTSNAYVKPLTVELQIDKSKGRIKDEWTLTSKRSEAYRNQFRRLIEHVISSVIQEMASAGLCGCKRPGPYR